MQPRLAILHRTIRLMQDVVPRFALTLDPEETRARRFAQAMAALCRDASVALPAAALQFPLRHSQVMAVIPGLVGADQVHDTIARLGASIPDTLWPALDAAARAHPLAKAHSHA